MLIEFCQENALVIANTLFQLHKRRLYTWTSPDGQHQNQDWLYFLQPKMEKLYTVNKNKTRSWLWLRSLTPYCKFRLKLKKVGKTTRPFRYDLNQIPYNCTVEVTNIFMGLDLSECLKNYGWRFVTLYRRQWSRPSQEKEMQKGKMVVWESLTNSWEKKRS